MVLAQAMRVDPIKIDSIGDAMTVMQVTHTRRVVDPKGDLVVGWKVRYRIAGATYEAPLAIDGRDMYEDEVEATTAYEGLTAAGLSASVLEVAGREVTYTRHVDDSPRCRVHNRVRATHKVTTQDMKIFHVCGTCVEMYGLPGLRVESIVGVECTCPDDYAHKHLTHMEMSGWCEVHGAVCGRCGEVHDDADDSYVNEDDDDDENRCWSCGHTHEGECDEIDEG